MPKAADAAVTIKWNRIEVVPSVGHDAVKVYVQAIVNVAGELVYANISFISDDYTQVLTDMTEALESKRTEYVEE